MQTIYNHILWYSLKSGVRNPSTRRTSYPLQIHFKRDISNIFNLFCFHITVFSVPLVDFLKKQNFIKI